MENNNTFKKLYDLMVDCDFFDYHHEAAPPYNYYLTGHLKKDKTHLINIIFNSKFVLFKTKYYATFIIDTFSYDFNITESDFKLLKILYSDVCDSLFYKQKNYKENFLQNILSK